LTNAQSQLRQSQPFGARVAALELLLDPRNQAESFGVPALRDQVVEIFLAPPYPRSELMRILRMHLCRRLQLPFVVERFLDLVQAPRSPPSQAVDEIGVRRVARYAFGVADDLFVKRREMLAFDERFTDRHLRRRKSARRRIAKLRQERGLLGFALRRRYDAVFALFPKRSGQGADQRLERFHLFVRTSRVIEAFDYQRPQFRPRLSGQAVPPERPQVERERFDPGLIARDD